MNTIYGVGGYDPGKPFGNAIEQYDDDTRVYTDYRSGVAVTRPYTTDENTLADARVSEIVAESNRVLLESRAQSALVANTSFLAITSPTNAQVLAQVKILTRECSALIKLLLRELSDTSGT